MTYPEGEIGQTNRQLIEARSVERIKSRTISDALAELVELVNSDLPTLGERQAIEELVDKIRTSRANAERRAIEIRKASSERNPI